MDATNAQPHPVWTFNSTSGGISSRTSIVMTIDISYDELLEQAKGELKRKVHAVLRRTSDTQIREWDNAGRWELKASDLVSPVRTLTTDRAMKKLEDEAPSMDKDDLVAFGKRLLELAKAQEAKDAEEQA